MPAKKTRRRSHTDPTIVRPRCQFYTPHGYYKSFSSPIRLSPMKAQHSFEKKVATHHVDCISEEEISAYELESMPVPAIYKAYQAKKAGQQSLRCAVQQFAWKVMESSMTKKFYREMLGNSRKALLSSNAKVVFLEDYMRQKGLPIQIPDFKPAPIEPVFKASPYDSVDMHSDKGTESDSGESGTESDSGGS
ncbi:hypothetical protein SERLADRAFT_441792 [Serpula lacrymans var. lacrymans S7.9]|uniref:Uncharacterized protein n=1 Tax=Serpula lacrymans var. lacrymans (strain S7.9) TaxID=578457 RepID=F8P7N7_SERL9|nr:uncharacterized protein SERLADRAFT_441792 [Serpula lacrymans var. lacrymans S7.9]EGO20445.1 hypothetical protein SERLADRAFT_441792 [Serpula lacrymans var. lacrymans S7.9]